MRAAISENPFTPSFGTVPPIMAGRGELLASMERAFSRRGRDPLLSSLLIGARGTGKTALLATIGDKASRAGWVSASSVAIPGMLEDVFEQATLKGRHLLEADPKRSLSSLGIGPLSVGWENAASESGNWRTRMTGVLDQLANYDTGLLITIDEVKADLEEMVTLAAVYQMFVTEQRKVALIMAGLPYHVHRLVSHNSVSFLRRAAHYQLGAIGNAEVSSTLRKTVEGSGKTIDEDGLHLCTQAIGGFPYLLQLVGYRIWERSEPRDLINLEDCRKGIKEARSEMDEHILAATYRELSPGDVRYLTAMLADSEETRTSDIAKRLGVSSGYASKYKERLLAQGVIGELQKGWVAFEIPGFREYLESRLDSNKEGRLQSD